MKKITLITLILTITISLVFPEVSVLVDFNKLKANGNGIDPDSSLAADDSSMTDYTNHDRSGRTQHMPTLVDYSVIAGTSFSQEEKDQMLISLSAYNWDIKFNDSAASIKNKQESMCTEWHSRYVEVIKDLVDPPETAPDGVNILAVKIRFPEEPHHAWALIKPPFEIPSYENIGTNYKGQKLDPAEMTYSGDRFENGFGVVKNVGTIKRIDLTAYGLNYNNSIAVLLKDEENKITEYHCGSLQYDGWRRLTWTNPNYIENVTHRDLFVVPLYPKFEPYVKIHGFRIYRPAQGIGGTFITYIKDVILTYDLAVLSRENEPVEHEPLWNILKNKAEEVKIREIRKLGFLQLLRFLEKLKMHKEFGPAE